MRHLVITVCLLACAANGRAAETVVKPENSVWDMFVAGSCAKAIYPKQSQRNEETGSVGLSFHIGLDGRVTDSEIIRSSTHPLLDEASRELIMSCVFPLKANMKPAVELQKVGYQWRLEGGMPFKAK